MVSSLLAWCTEQSMLMLAKIPKFTHCCQSFTSVRDWSNKIFSDHGSQLVAASKELQDIIKGIDWDLLKRYSVNHNTEWQFVPADSSWVNRATEELSKIVKRALNAAAGEQVLPLIKLQTVMFEAGQIVNQKPIGVIHIHQKMEHIYIQMT